MLKYLSLMLVLMGSFVGFLYADNPHELAVATVTDDEGMRITGGKQPCGDEMGQGYNACGTACGGQACAEIPIYYRTGDGDWTIINSPVTCAVCGANCGTVNAPNQKKDCHNP